MDFSHSQSPFNHYRHRNEPLDLQWANYLSTPLRKFFGGTCYDLDNAKEPRKPSLLVRIMNLALMILIPLVGVVSTLAMIYKTIRITDTYQTKVITFGNFLRRIKATLDFYKAYNAKNWEKAITLFSKNPYLEKTEEVTKKYQTCLSNYFPTLKTISKINDFIYQTAHSYSHRNRVPLSNEIISDALIKGAEIDILHLNVDPVLSNFLLNARHMSSPLRDLYQKFLKHINSLPIQNPIQETAIRVLLFKFYFSDNQKTEIQFTEWLKPLLHNQQIKIARFLNEHENLRFIETVYEHCKSIFLQANSETVSSTSSQSDLRNQVNKLVQSLESKKSQWPKTFALAQTMQNKLKNPQSPPLYDTLDLPSEEEDNAFPFLFAMVQQINYLLNTKLGEQELLNEG